LVAAFGCHPRLEYSSQPGNFIAADINGPLTYTAPSGNGSNAIVLTVNGSNPEVFDNGSVVAQQAISNTTSVALTGGTSTSNTFEIRNTAGVPTAVNLTTGSDLAFVTATNGNVVLYGQLGGVVYLYGDSSTSNTFVGTPTGSYMFGTGYVNEAGGFQTVYAYSGTANDTAYPPASLPSALPRLDRLVHERRSLNARCDRRIGPGVVRIVALSTTSRSCPTSVFHFFPDGPVLIVEQGPLLRVSDYSCISSKGISLPTSFTRHALAKPRGFIAPWMMGAPAESPILFVKFASGDGLKALLDRARERAQVARINLSTH
jgi:hypothetical protein